MTMDLLTTLTTFFFYVIRLFFNVDIPQFVQKLDAVKMFLLSISETFIALLLSIYRWKALSEQKIYI